MIDLRQDTSHAPAHADTPVELLRMRASTQREQTSHVFLVDGAREEVGLTYGELDCKARAIGARLQHLGAAGERVLLLYPAGLDFVAAFWGCLYAGAVAVPAYPPRPNRSLRRLQAIAADAGASIALAGAPVMKRLDAVCGGDAPALKTLRWIDTDDIEDRLADVWQETRLKADALALLQYTSGSTGVPKGVMLSHRNLLHNAAMVYRACEHSPDDRYVSWLPVFHDMGFMAGVLQPLYGGLPVVLMSPTAFLQKPLRWLQAISRHRATVSGAPDFAYDLCVRKISDDERATLDLSSWSVAFNGAEPVRHETLKQFARAFEPCGFRMESFFPCYGLAEATLMVSGSRKAVPPVVETFAESTLENVQAGVSTGTGRARRRTLVGCGQALPESEVLIVNPERSTLCPDGHVGEIWVSSASVAMGYWKREVETRETFHARLAGEFDGGRRFLRTGDLGILEAGELFIAGRLKDLIIIRGLNHYPQDIEWTVERSHAALRNGAGAAFSLEVAGEERLVVVQEMERRAQVTVENLVECVRAAIAEEHELQVYAVALVKAGSIPKTSSGKIQRRACRDAFIAGNLEIVAEWRASPADGGATPTPLPIPSRHDAAQVGDWLVAQLAESLKMRAGEIDVHRPLTHYGFDSLTAIELTHAIETGLGVSIPAARLLDRMSAAELKTEIVSRPVEAASSPDVPASVITAASDHPPSHGQRSLWFLHQLAPRSDAYHIAKAARIKTTLDLDALQRVWQKLVRRHASLRTTFHVVDGKLVQRVHEHSSVLVEVVDAPAWDDGRIAKRLDEDASRPFDLESAPLFRVSVFRRATGDDVLLLVFHHIVVDLWSLAVVVREMGVLYEAEMHGDSSSEGTSPAAHALQYTDYARRQSSMLAGERGARLREFWRKELAGDVGVLQLPTDFARATVQGRRGTAATAFELGAELTERLRDVGRACDATLFMTLLAAFEVLLYRYTEQESFAVGTAMAGRREAELSGVVGYFVNPVVMRAELAGNVSFASLLEQVRRKALRAFEHQDFPFPMLVEELQPHRQASRTPLFEVMFMWQQAPAGGAAGLSSFALNETGASVISGNLNLESMALKPRAPQFDLTLSMTESARGLAGSIEYDAELFEEATVTRMAEHFQCLLESIAAAPEQRLSELSLSSERERRQLLVEGNGGQSATRPQCVHEMFEQQAEKTPDAVALVCRDERLTYRELNERANRLAHYLGREGVGAEVLVAVLLERTSEMVASLLGVLKAGGAYLPLDAAYPQERLAFTLRDSRARVLITEHALAALQPEHGAKVISIDAERERLSRLPASNPEQRTRAENLAYVMYTSGSTGQPKGVAIEHHSVSALLDWARATFSPHELSGVLASTSICFDISVFELFAPLACGGKVVLVENALHLPGLPVGGEVTLVNTVPSVMDELVQTTWTRGSVETVTLVGEPLHNALVRRIYHHRGVERVFNLYGPTEDTVYSTSMVVERDAKREPDIGRPLAGGQVYILDRHRRLAPLGVAGEIYLGGEGLARGYLHQPELTAERFIPHPLSDEAGARLYRTGDLARRRTNGAIEYVGRADTQVKVRGYRVELGEIEAVLCTNPEVRQAAVVIGDGVEGERRLVAYVVAEREQRPSQNDLQMYLKERLPAYMLPSAYVMLDALPLTPNGKVDRRALPTALRVMPEAEAVYVAPRTANENSIAAIWQSVLALERVDIDTNFFELGGHSLSMFEVYRRLKNSFAHPFALTDLFEHPTVSALARFFEQHTRQDSFQHINDAARLQKRALARRRQLTQQGRKRS